MTTKKEAAELERLLRARALVLHNEIRTQLLESDEQHYIDLAGMVGDVADVSVADMLTDVDIAEMDRDVSELREIEAALARIVQGKYGVCADCGTEIDYERLAAQPAATRCIGCQAKREKVYVHTEIPRL
jgi:RNA polymerase-binding transcription factor